MNKAHDRAAFTCGEYALDRYLKQSAGQDLRRGLAVTYVLAESTTPDVIAGFYTLSASSVPLDTFPDETARRLARYPNVPVALIGRLATDIRYRGQHCGSRPLVDALIRICTISETVIGLSAAVVDAKNEDAARFYEHFGFTRFQHSVPPRLFIPLKTARAAVQPLLPKHSRLPTDI